MFPWQQKTHTSRRKLDEDVDSDSELIDETVKVSNKRIRNDSQTNDNSNVENFETLNKKWSDINEELRKLRVKLANISAPAESKPSYAGQDSGDSLEDFMASIGHKKYGLSISDKIEKSNIKMKINLLVKEQQKLEKLIKIAKPSVEFEEISQQKSTKTNDSSSGSQSIIESISETTETTEKVIERDLKEEIKRKTEAVIKDLKNSSKQQKSDSSLKLNKNKLKAQSIVEAIEKEKKCLEKTKQTVGYDSDYVDWLPPADQSGDGKTSLNEKLGY